MDEAQKQVTMFKWGVSGFVLILLMVLGSLVARERWACQCKANECLSGKPCPAKVGCKDCAGCCDPCACKDCAGCCDPCACKDCGCKGCACKKGATK